VTTEAIRRSLGDFSHLKSPFKYCARLGLTLSISIPTFEIHDFQVENIPDILRNDFCFSDGCGQISREYAEKITQSLHLDYVPCYFQVTSILRNGTHKSSDPIPRCKGGDHCPFHAPRNSPPTPSEHVQILFRISCS
jgi:hypothetical protein